MRVALVNPNWSFEGSIYFGCREPHLPLELGYSKALLEENGHEAVIMDAHAEGLSGGEIFSRAEAFSPDLIVITTAPTYLFWRCPPPELSASIELSRHLKELRCMTAVVGPHASATPETALKKLGADIAITGECEEVLLEMAQGKASGSVYPGPSLPRETDMKRLPALMWTKDEIARHAHHHHRFDSAPRGPGAEVEYSRGCPYRCSFCARENFRGGYRKRPVETFLKELDHILSFGTEYVYFIDEIFMPDMGLLKGLSGRNLKFGIQTRIDIWSFEALSLLGEAGCVSVEAGVESITEEGREAFGKRCRLTNDELIERLLYAKRKIPFVQANLLCAESDRREELEAWRERLMAEGVWANRPVPLFPYPGSPEYRRRWGAPDASAWERAHEFYLRSYEQFSDIQGTGHLPLQILEERKKECEDSCHGVS